MKRILLVALSLLVTAPVLAEDEPANDKAVKIEAPTSPENFDKGVEAYARGDFGSAYDLWLPYAQAGDPAAQRNLALMHKKGLGVPQDDQRAFELYKMASYSGLVTAMANLALAYYLGEGTEKNLTEARHWFEEAARRHHALAQYHYAYMLLRGLGGLKDEREAYEWFAVAAFQGIEPAGQWMVMMIDELPPPSVLRNYQRKGPPPSHKRGQHLSPQMLEAQRPGALR